MGKKQRLDKALGHLGVATRSELKRMTKHGRIKVNGTIVKDSSLQIDPETDRLEVDGKLLHYKQFVYIMLHKPQGVVSATEDNRDRTVIDLLDDSWRAFDLFPVGRLDKDTEGLLLLTNDGGLAHDLLSPRKHVPKTYFAQVKGAVNEVDRLAFERGVTLEDGYVTKPAELVAEKMVMQEGHPVSTIRLTIREGKFHQVKRMFESVGKQVVYLKRLSMGSLELDPALPAGAYRELTEDELERLRNYTARHN